MPLRIRIFMLLFLAGNMFCLSQEIQFRFKNITVNDGLSNNLVRSIRYDLNGRIFIATQQGLNVYDGYAIKSFGYKPEKGKQIPSNFFVSLCPVYSGMYVGSLSGLYLFNSANNTLEGKNLLADYPHSGFKAPVIRDDNGYIWVGTYNGGVFIIDEKQNKILANISTENSIILSNNIYGITFLNKQTALITTSNGINSIEYTDFRRKKFSVSSLLTNNLLREDKFFETVCSDSIIWGITAKGRLYRWKGINEIKHKILSECQIILKQTKTGEEIKFDFFTLLLDTKNNLWIGTNSEGLILFNTENDVDLNKKEAYVKNIKNNAQIVTSLAGNQVFCFTEDMTGKIWIGTDQGVSVYAKENQEFSFVNLLKNEYRANTIVNNLLPVNDNFFIAGTDNSGIFLSNNNFSEIKPIYPPSGKNSFISFFYDKANHRIFEGWTSSLNYFNSDLPLKNFASFPDMPKFRSSVFFPGIAPEVYSLAKTSNNKLYAGTSNGLYAIEDSNKELVAASLKDFQKKVVFCLLADSQNRLWIGTATEGIQLVNGEDLSPISFFNSETGKLSDNTVNCIYETNDHTIWVGTNSGLNRYTSNLKTISFYNTDSGLPNNSIQSIIGDKENSLWIGTDKGLSKFDPQQNVFTNYSAEDGLQSNSFMRGSVCKLKNGKILFGNVKGLVAFYPGEVKPGEIPSQIVLTDFKIFNRSVIDDTVSESKPAVLSGKIIELSHEQNFFSISFSALDYINAGKVKYKYILTGFDKDTIDAGSRNEAYYTNVPPGEYTFKIKAGYGDGRWSKDFVLARVSIKPAFTRTWYFRLLLCSIAAMIIMIFIRQRMKNIEIKKQTEIVDHASKMKEEFLANMSHEIRTPLNAIVGLSRLMMKKETFPGQLKYLNAIEQSGENLLVIVNDILDFSKIDAGKLKIENIPFNLETLLNTLDELLAHKAAEKNLSLNFEKDPSVPAYLIGDPTRLMQIVTNLVGNAIKFTNDGSVKIICKQAAAETESNGKVAETFTLLTEVKDTGIGIAFDKIEKIFESFTQASADTTRKYGGTGLGLAITKKLIEMQNGKISVTSELGKGTVFSFYIPYLIATEQILQKDKSIVLKNDRTATKISILLAEDNIFNQLVAIDTLREELSEVTVDVAENGKQAIDKISEKEYDVILMDVQMPEMDGLEATRIIRKHPNLKIRNSRIIAMTAGALKSEIDKCFAAGMDDYITKPFIPEELVQKIFNVVDKTHS
jgi:signal transduction histidine kinase/ligand-binding sensor domain-containing protein/CheY-like chemotaxis protein